MRTLNLKLLNDWLEENGPRSKELLAAKAEISSFSVGRILKGEKRPTGPEQIAICLATGIKRDELFPATKQEKSA